MILTFCRRSLIVSLLLYLHLTFIKTFNFQLNELNVIYFNVVLIPALIYFFFRYAEFISRKIIFVKKKSSFYECGYNNFFIFQKSFSLQYFLICFLFLIFDLEFLFLIFFLSVFLSINISLKLLLRLILTLLILITIKEWTTTTLEWVK